MNLIKKIANVSGMGKGKKRKAQGQPNGAAPAKKVIIQDTVITDPEELKRTILAPFYNRIHADYNTITNLNNELRELRSGNKPEAVDPNASPEKLAQTHPLANQIRQALDQPVPDETIHLCGLAPLRIIASRPKDVLALANENLHARPYAQVATCWRRLYEEASLYTVVDLLDSVAANFFGDSINLLAAVIKQLDAAVVIAGAPGRKALIEEAFKQLEDPVFHFASKIPQYFCISPPPPLAPTFPIMRASYVWPIDSFQMHLDNYKYPIIIPNALNTWPASQLWHDANYLKRRTLGGHRSVPVEVGNHYMEASWGQKIMTFNDFLNDYLIPANPQQIGYLAQHDIFAQIPVLREDINIPDYCFSNPPPPSGAAANTAGLADAQELNEPLINAWLGPKGTKTPLHTDPYHNILCQVVGYKYVRLYAPDQAEKLYPAGVNEAGILMNNTSQVDVSQCRYNRAMTDLDKIRETQKKFPLFSEAEYQEAILAPGESLYIPLGYWHYVESLTTSFSVSFWFN